MIKRTYFARLQVISNGIVHGKSYRAEEVVSWFKPNEVELLKSMIADTAKVNNVDSNNVSVLDFKRV